MSDDERSAGILSANAHGQDARAPFFDPYAEIEVHERSLPHWQQECVTYFVTWRLADSLPQNKLRQWMEEKQIWLRTHPQPLSVADAAQYHRLFSAQMDQWLDAGEGACVLREGAIRKMVVDALRYFDGQRYDLESFVVMPNHVHVLFQIRPERRIEDILHSWKSFTARTINRRLGVSGTFWQEEYWDRMIRSERHLQACKGYIRDNPVKGKLAVGEFTHYERSTGILPVLGDAHGHDARAPFIE